jgi:protein-export membrane protein SecD
MDSINNALRDKSISLSSATANMSALPKDILSMFPTGYILMTGKEGRYFLVKSIPELTGAYLTNAKVQLGGDTGMGYPEVSIEFNPEGAKLFAQITESNIDRNLAIVLDGIVQSAPTIRTRIPDGRAVIEGNFTTDDARMLSTVLRAGALPVPVEIIEERTVGPTLGEDSIRAGILSSIIGVFLVMLFLGYYYRGAGLIANIALLFNLLLVIACMAYLHATLTLPGIAGMVLSLAMAVDANVLIIERMREELISGKTIKMIIDLGYDKALSAIIDSNLTTLISALFLYQFGTGPIKGFAVTLTIGLIASMFTAIFCTRAYYDWRLRDRAVTTISV